MKQALYASSVIAAILLGAGCAPSAPNPQPSTPPIPTTPMAPSAEKPSTEKPVTTEYTWKTYTDSNLGYSLDYPTLDASHDWSPAAGKLDLSPFPKHEYRNRELTVEAKRVPAGIACPTAMETSTPNGLVFCLTKTEEGAAGSIYGTYVYRGLVNGVMLTLTFVERHVTDPRVIGGCEDGTSKEEKCEPFDATRDNVIFGEILKRIQIAPVSDTVSMTNVSIKKQKPNVYDVDISFPQVDKGDAELAAAFNAAVRNPIDKEVSQFVTDALQAEKDKVIGSQIWSLSMDPAATYQSPRLLNSFLSGSTYTGGAHPNSIYQNVILDRATRKSLHVSDIFIDAKKGLAFLSAKSIESLKKEAAFKDMSDQDWLKTGTTPKDDNFKQTHFNNEGLIVEFPAYQVAAYAAGPQKVFIPWKDISSFIKPEYLPAVK